MTIDFTPSRTVGKFIQDYIPNELFYSFICGPIGSAKTTASLMKIPFMAKLQEPGPDGLRHSKVVVVRNTTAQLTDTTLASFGSWFKDGEAGKWYATLKKFLMRFDDVECEILFRPLDTPDDVARVLSLEVTFAVLDEFVQIPSEIVEALSGRCGRYPARKDGGATNFGMWGSSNPGETETYWHDFLIENRPDNVQYFHQPSGLSPEAENLENLPNKYYENQMKGKSNAWIQQFIHAEWGFSIAGDPVVATFNRQLHVAGKRLIPDPYLPLIIGYDPGMSSALIFGQYDMYGRLCIVDEMVLKGFGTERMIRDRLLPRLKMKYSGFEVIIAPDPAGNSRTPTDERTVVQVLKQQKYKKFWSVKVDNTNLLQPRLDAIDYFTTRLTEVGPAFLVDPSCRKTIRALASGWRYENTQKGEEKSKPVKNESSHPGDGVGYLCRYCVTNEARNGKRGTQKRFIIPRFTNSYVAR
jgi:hypothetical protein